MDWVLKLLQIIASWPVLALVVVLIFREKLSGLIGRINGLKTPFGEINTTQQETMERLEGDAPLGEPAPAVRQNDNPQGVELQELRRQLGAERQARYLWEYAYLNYYLAPSTQNVLNWLLSQREQGITRPLYDAVWTPVISAANERQAILEALEKHYLIQFVGDLMNISPKGIEYAEWGGRRILFSSRTLTPPVG